MVWAIGNPAQSTALTELIQSQSSDRVVAIVGGAILEDALREALISRFRSPEGHRVDLNEKLFRVGGPLGFFMPKVDLAYQLYVFEKSIRNAMYGIGEIRNLFAHQLDMKFSSPAQKMIDAINKLSAHEGRTHYPLPFGGVEKDSEYKLKATETPRDKFFVNLKLCLIWLMGDNMRHGPYNNIPLMWGPIQQPSLQEIFSEPNETHQL